MQEYQRIRLNFCLLNPNADRIVADADSDKDKFLEHLV
jgi:hypothetical protein